MRRAIGIILTAFSAVLCILSLVMWLATSLLSVRVGVATSQRAARVELTGGMAILAFEHDGRNAPAPGLYPLVRTYPARRGNQAIADVTGLDFNTRWHVGPIGWGANGAGLVHLSAVWADLWLLAVVGAVLPARQLVRRRQEARRGFPVDPAGDSIDPGQGEEN